jgi:hypothetical protein
MPTILLKKSDTPGSVPGTANLTNLAGGVEVAVNTADKRVYSMTSASAVIELGTNPSSLTCSDVSATVLRAGSATITNLLATTLTVSGGTANGVLYLNGSKVATSGSALTFDGTDFKMPNGGSMLLGASASGASLLLINGTAAAQRLVLGTSGTDAVINATRTSGTSPNLLFQLEGANSMALTSTGLGIGTASPGAKLHVLGSNFVGIFAGTNANTVYTEYRYNSTTTSGLIGNGSSLLSAAADSDFIVRSEGALKFATNGNNFRAVIDTSGNLGLGVTPSLWRSTEKVIQIGSWMGLFTDSGVTTEVSYNNYINSSNQRIYQNTGYALRYQQYNGIHSWHTAPSGTAGNQITGANAFDQMMTLDASGRLLVGTTSGTATITANASGGATIRALRESVSATNHIQMEHDGTDGKIAVSGANALIFATNSTNQARITSGGLFLVNAITSSGFGDGHRIFRDVAENTTVLSVDGGTEFSAQFRDVAGGGYSTAGTAIIVGKNSSTSRSINAGGTVNASGADYAEYMEKAGEFFIAKGDVCGIDADGKLTNVYANAVAFVVKSTNPSYVGGDSWGAGYKDDPEGLEAARQKVDRIAFSGQVPVNVLGATPGQYIVPGNDNGAIKGVAVSNPSFEQYQMAIGKVIAIEDDGRARIIVKIA